MLQIKNTKQFKKDLKRYKNYTNFIRDLNSVIEQLAKLQPLEERYKDHPLVGSWINYRECHVKNDVLLIYRIYENDKLLFLERLGSHSELFK